MFCSQVNRVPWLRRVVVDATKTWIKEEMLWPQRMLIPAEKNVAKGEKPGFVLTDVQLKKVLAEDPLLLAEQRLKSLQQIATGEIGQKREPGEGLASGDEDDPTGPDIDVELTDPSNPRVVPPKPTAQAQAWAWLSGKFVFYHRMGAIRLMSCFVYRHREGHRRQNRRG